jgi:hypothetical protein
VFHVFSEWCIKTQVHEKYISTCTNIQHIQICVKKLYIIACMHIWCVYVWMYVRMCACMYVFISLSLSWNIHIYIYIFIYLYVCIWYTPSPCMHWRLPVNPTRTGWARKQHAVLVGPPRSQSHRRPSWRGQNKDEDGSEIGRVNIVWGRVGLFGTQQ